MFIFVGPNSINEKLWYFFLTGYKIEDKDVNDSKHPAEKMNSSQTKIQINEDKTKIPNQDDSQHDADLINKNQKTQNLDF